MRMKQLIRALENRKKELAATRDALREIVSEAEELLDRCESAHENIEVSIDELSELV